MASVTGLTATRMLAIEASSIVGGYINGSGHLILTKHDGTTIDAGDALVAVPYATTTQSGSIELATSAEVNAFTDDTRAVTPAGLVGIDTRLDALELGTTVRILSGIAESAGPSSYPTGTSLLTVGPGSGWSLNSGFGSVITNNISSDRCVQNFYSSNGGTNVPKVWVRTYHSSDGGGGWTAWQQVVIMANLNAASYSQSSAISSYPRGQSRIYFTDITSAGWDFAGNWGELVTYRDGDDFARQTWTKHASSSGFTEIWNRTANAAGGWSPWSPMSQGANTIFTTSTAPTAGTWYRIATFTGAAGVDQLTKASAEFVISATGAGQHVFLRLRASVAYADTNHASLLLEECAGYSTNNTAMFTKCRIVSLNGTYDGHALDIYCAAAPSDTVLKIHVKHDDWMQTGSVVKRWGSIGMTSTPSTPTAPQAVMVQKGMSYTSKPIAPTLVNNWANFGAGYEPVGHQMLPGNIVSLSGLMKLTSGSIDSTGNTPAFILPEGCRPSNQRLFVCDGSDAIARVDVFPDGKVSMIQGNPFWVTLEGIKFQATQ